MAQKRKLILAIILNSACTIDYAALTAKQNFGTADNPINIQHTAYFNDPTTAVNEAIGFTPDPQNANLQAQIEAKKQEGYTSACNGYKEMWWAQLTSCVKSKLNSSKDAILGEMANVCVLGSDEQHLNGSSSINPAKTALFKSFEEVIKFYIDRYNATAATADKIDLNQCNGLLISYPLSYKTVFPANKPILNKPDACDCQQIATVRARWQALPAATKDASFSDYLKRTQQIDISNADLDMLNNLCNGAYSCNFLPTAINLPPGLQCGSADVCVPCSRVAEVFTAFTADYPGIKPSLTGSSAQQQQQNLLFSRYMNSRLGFAKQAYDYLSFMQQCGTILKETNADCSSLQQLLIDYAKQRRKEVYFLGNDDVLIPNLSSIVSNGAMIPEANVKASEQTWWIEQSIRPKGGSQVCFKTVMPWNTGSNFRN